MAEPIANHDTTEEDRAASKPCLPLSAKASTKMVAAVAALMALVPVEAGPHGNTVLYARSQDGGGIMLSFVVRTLPTFQNAIR